MISKFFIVSRFLSPSQSSKWHLYLYIPTHFLYTINKINIIFPPKIVHFPKLPFMSPLFSQPLILEVILLDSHTLKSPKTFLSIYFLYHKRYQPLRAWAGSQSESSSGIDSAAPTKNIHNFWRRGAILLDKLPLSDYQFNLEEIMSRYLGRIWTVVCLPQTSLSFKRIFRNLVFLDTDLCKLSGSLSPVFSLVSLLPFTSNENIRSIRAGFGFGH